MENAKLLTKDGIKVIETTEGMLFVGRTEKHEDHCGQPYIFRGHEIIRYTDFEDLVENGIRQYMLPRWTEIIIHEEDVQRVEMVRKA